MKFLQMLFFILLCKFPAPIFAQLVKPLPNQTTNENGLISGHVIDSQSGETIAGATVSLLTGISEEKKMLTDEKGSFRFVNLPEGSYSINVTFIGYKINKGKILTLDADHAELKSILIGLTDADQELNEVKIVGSKPYLENKIDRVIINVSSLLSNTGTNAIEVLNNAPGVEVLDNSISLRGKSGVFVYIDGRQTYLAGKDLMNYLQSLPSGTIEKIEIIPNPPASFHVNGNAGVINIITKKNTAEGFTTSLSLSYGQGKYGKTFDNANLSYKTGKVNIFSSLGYSKVENYYDVDRTRLMNHTSSPYVIDQKNFERSNTKAYNYKIGVDYEIDKNNNLGIAFSNFNNDYKETGYYTLDFKQENRLPDSIIKTNSYLKEITKTKLFNLNYLHKFKNTENSIVFDIDYLNYTRSSDQSLFTNSYLSNDILYDTYSLHTDNEFEADTYSAKVDFNTSILNNIKLASGLQTIHSERNSNNNYSGRLDDFNLPGQSLSNRLKYREDINSIYLNLSKSLKRLTMQAGLRYELANSTINQFENGVQSVNPIKYNFGNLIPTAYLSYKLDSAATNTILFSYGRRISRPDYQNLNPSIFFFDKYTSNQGNSMLQPEKSSNFDLSYNHGSNFTLGTSFSYTNDAIISFYKLNDNSLVNTSVNIDKVANFILYSNYSVPLTKKWSVNFNEELTHSSYKGLISDNGSLNNTVTAFRITGSSQFKFSNTWSAELYGQYRSRRTLGQGIYEPLWLINGAIQKKVFSNRGAFNFTARDIFHTIIIKRDIQINGAQILIRNENDTRIFNLSFTYKFGSAGSAKSTKNGLENEQKRVGM